jgi:hypothetical protein
VTDQQLLNIFQHPGINASWFARRVFEGQRGHVETKFIQKLNNYNGTGFTKQEMQRLREIMFEFASYPI